MSVCMYVCMSPPHLFPQPLLPYTMKWFAVVFSTVYSILVIRFILMADSIRQNFLLALFWYDMNSVTKWWQSSFLVWTQRNVCFIFSWKSKIYPYLFVFEFLIIKNIYTWKKPQGRWLMVWGGKKWGFLHIIIYSVVHFLWTYFFFQLCALMPKISTTQKLRHIS